MSFWDKFLSFLRRIFSVEPPVTIPVPTKDEAPIFEPPWLTWAKKELGQHEIRGGENPRIVWYHSHATETGVFKEDEIPWCASFLCSALRETGFNDTNNARAASYLNFGTPCDKDKNGAITVFRWADGSYHVSIRAINSDFPGKTYLGGNQSDSVCFKDFDQRFVVASRWPV